jgi:polyferredoxin
MNLWNWYQFGEIQMFHPAGVFIFLGITLGSFVLGKFFCSWMCPIGAMSEWIWKFRDRWFPLPAIPYPRWSDCVLRSVKYILLAFFLVAIFGLMDAKSVQQFLDSEYNMVADAKMFDFFANISIVTSVFLGVITLATLFVRQAWCRIFCPYGALLGIIGLLSPNKIRRDANSCINCEKCTNVCPAGIVVHQTKLVVSDECSSCQECLAICPANGALSVNIAYSNTKLQWRLLPVLALGMFGVCVIYGVATKRWWNSIPDGIYRDAISNRKNTGHPGRTGAWQK